MYRLFVLGTLLVVFVLLIKRNRVYWIPFISLIYTNVNGLLDWEDFGFHGVIKFTDYGLLLSFLLIIHDRFGRSPEPVRWGTSADRSALYRSIMAYWGYYLFEFAYSIILQGDIEWPIKMGRVFFYGLFVFVAYFSLKPNPIVLFGKIIHTLMILTVGFGVMYIAYNLWDVDFYPKGAHEEFIIDNMNVVKRNFAGFPSLTFYFLILFVHRIFTSNRARILYFFGITVLVFCVFLSLTRGAIMAMVMVVVFTIVMRRPSAAGVAKMVALLVGGALAALIFFQFAQGHVAALALRFSEVEGIGGATKASSFLIRANEFSRIIDNVLEFNPLFGFGFTNISLLGLGYESSLLHGGSADNGFSNLIGTTGFLGLGLFTLVMILWLRTNVKLQLLNRESYSKVHFIFIFYMMVSFINGASMSYMYNYGLFLVYDLLAFSYLKAQKPLVLAPRDQRHIDRGKTYPSPLQGKL